MLKNQSTGNQEKLWRDFLFQLLSKHTLYLTHYVADVFIELYIDVYSEALNSLLAEVAEVLGSLSPVSLLASF